MILAVGNMVRFNYNGKNRVVKIEKVKRSAGNIFVGPCPLWFTGWDYTVADSCEGFWRTFKCENVDNLEIVKKVENEIKDLGCMNGWENGNWPKEWTKCCESKPAHKLIEKKITHNWSEYTCQICNIKYNVDMS